MVKKAILVLMAVALVAAPAAARPRHGHHHGWRHDGGHWNDGHRRGVDDEVFLWLGLTAVGLTALHVMSQPPRHRYQETGVFAPPAALAPPVAWQDDQAWEPLRPVREGFVEDGEYCREFQHEVRIGGRYERAWGRACLEEDGSWRIVP